MGARCSKAAKPKSPPSSRRYVSVGCCGISFPPRKSKRYKRKQDTVEVSRVEQTFSRAENAVEGASGEDFNDQPSTSGFTEFTEVIPISLKQDSWEDVSQPRQRYTGTIARLKKKDSTRRPTYKDEIMLSDNIDSIVEKEIPEIPDDESALESDIECIHLGDDIPAVKSNKMPDEIEEGDLKSKHGISSVCIPPLKERLQESMDEEDIRVETEIQQMLKDGPFQRAKSYSTKTRKIENDSELEMDIAYIMSDDLGEAELNGGLSCGKASSTAKTQQPTNNSKRRTKKEGKLHNAVDKEPEEDIALNRNNDVVVDESNRQISSGKVSSTKMAKRPEGCPTKEKTNTEEKELENDSSFIFVSDSNGQLIAGSISRSSPKGRTDPDDQKLTEDIKDILSDEVVSSEYNGQISSCPVSAMKHRKSSSRKREHNDENVATGVDNASKEHITADNGQVSPKQASPKKRVSFPEINHADDNLAKNVQDDHLNRNISSSLDAPPGSESPSKSQVSSKKASPKKRVSFQEINLTDDDMAKDFMEDPSNGKQSSSLAGLPPPEKEFTRKHSKQADDQLEKDILYILNDDIFSVEPEIPVSSSPLKELPRPKTSNPKLSLAMDMDRIFDPDSIDDNLEDDIEYILNDDHDEVPPNTKKLAHWVEPISLSSDAARNPKKPSIKTSKRKEEESPHTNQYSVQDKAVQGMSTSNESSSPSSVSCLSKRTRTRMSKRTATAEVAEETETLIDPSSPRLVRHPRTISKRTRAILEGKAMPKDVDHELKEDLNASESIQRTSHTSSSLPRPKTRNPKRALDMNMSGIQGSSPTTYISRSVARPKQDFIQRPMQATSKLTPNSSVQSTCSEKPRSSAKTAPRNNTNSTNKPKDVLIREVDTTMETPSSSSGDLLASKTSIREQNYAMKTSKRPPKETEGENLDDIINEILEISTDDSDTSGKNPTASGKSLGENFPKSKQSKNTEEDDLKEVINDILAIPMGDSCASGNNGIASGRSVRKNSTRQLPKQSKHKEEVNLNEAINEISSKLPRDGSSASGKTRTVPRTRLIRKSVIQPEQSNRIETTPSKTSIHKSSGYSPCSSLGMVYEIGELALMEQIERESAQTPVGVDVSNNASPNGKASVSSSHGNHGSGFSVASGDNVRPMAAGSAEISAMHFSACPNTAKLPSHGGVTGVNSHRTFSGITYESDEEMLMDQIEKESLRL